MIQSPKFLLHILVITYNRARQLSKTLNSLADSPFNGFPLTVLDNNSDDNTMNVCQQYRKYFDNYEYIRHKYNIGGGANLLRAWELVCGRYFWILCDDDRYDFSMIGDVLAALDKGEADAIYVGKPNRLSWPRGAFVNVHDHVLRFGDFFTEVNFLPALIVKSDILSSAIICNAYRNIHTCFPQYIVSKHLYDANKIMWISKNPIVTREAPEVLTLPPLYWLKGWLINTNKLQPRCVADKAFRTFYLGGYLPKLLMHDIIMQKIDFKRPVILELVEMFTHGTMRLRISIIMSIPVVLTPGPIWSAIRRLYRIIKYDLMKIPRPNGYNIKKQDDPFRY